MSLRRDKVSATDRMAEIVDYVRLHGHDAPAVTTVGIAAHFQLPRQQVLRLCHALRAVGRLDGFKRTRSSPVVWNIGAGIVSPASPTAPKKSPSIALPTQRTVSTWAPHHVRDPLDCYFFGPGRLP